MKATLGNVPRKKLADISNIPQEMRLGSQNDKSQHISIGPKEYIDMLKKENIELMKMLADRNKLIELTGAEIQKMRINQQKMQQQNHQLAQSNSQMLAELNSAKDRLKTLQHELGCTHGMLKAKKLEAEEIAKQKMCQQLNDEVDPIKCEEAGDSSLGNGDNDKPANIKRRLQSKSLGSSKQVQPQDNAENKRPRVRRQSARFKPEAMKHDENDFEEVVKQKMCQQLNNEVEPIKCEEAGDSSLEIGDNDKPANIKRRPQSKCLGTSKQVQPLDKADNKRPCLRRQSARFKPEEPKQDEDYFEVEDKCPPMVNLVQQNGSASFSMSPNDVESNPALRFESTEFGRLSLSRPLRNAAKKIQSYKEIPLNIKMRRPV
ncbi:SHUGOSHIN 2-like [Nicotiana tomentosiformis]|uniref:SHUGOSHIN 2-like n=1 Tax=Nicotiana tomentosiformis TaxID=4098 RepID=UPI00051AE3A9|nr:shugoshin-1-like [Nicotiana tomentosiformis]